MNTLEHLIKTAPHRTDEAPPRYRELVEIVPQAAPVERRRFSFVWPAIILGCIAFYWAPFIAHTMGGFGS